MCVVKVTLPKLFHQIENHQTKHRDDKNNKKNLRVLYWFNGLATDEIHTCCCKLCLPKFETR